MKLEELKNAYKGKSEFIQKDIIELLEYHKYSGVFTNSNTYSEFCQLKILTDLLKRVKKMEDQKEIKEMINTFIISMNPL